MNPLFLDARVAVITGGASGLGLGIAQALGAQGARIAIIDNSARLSEAEQLLSEAGIEVLAISADVTDSEATKAATDAIVERFGRIDILCANAGINGVWAPVEEVTVEEFDHVMNVNMRGSFLSVKHAVPHLKAKGGSIVFTSSVNGTVCFSNTGASIYGSTKAAQTAFSKMLAVELGPFGIRVNSISPGYIPSNIHEGTIHRNTESIHIPAHFPKGATPLKHKGTVEDIGNLVLFLVSDMAAHITGQIVTIDAGLSLVRG